SEPVLDDIMTRGREPASRLNPAVPASLSTVIERMLERDPTHRYASCEEVAAALAGARASVNGTLPDPAPHARVLQGIDTRADAKPRPRPVLRAAAIVAFIAAAGAAVWLRTRPPGLPRDRALAFLLPATPGAAPEFADFAQGSLELLASRLQRHQNEPGFQLVPIRESRGEHLASVTDARKLLGANLALVSSFEQSGNTLTGHLELREPLRGRLIGERTIQLPQSEPLVWSDSLYRSALALLHLPLRPGNPAEIGVRGAGTLEYLARGIGCIQTAESESDLARGRDDLETAFRMEPEAALPRAWPATAGLRTHPQTHG